MNCKNICRLVCILNCFLVVWAQAASAQISLVDKVKNKQWLHGQKDCSQDKAPAIDMLKLTESTYIFRQNKCIHYEAPFIYLLLGKHKALLLDTGATADANRFPLKQIVKKTLQRFEKKFQLKPLELVVAHSHSHSDHYAGDAQFFAEPKTKLVKPDNQSVISFFNFTNWPLNSSYLNLGGRELTVIPIPGHQQDSIAVYDPETRFLLTGDSFYPGRLYIRNWSEFAASIERLVSFSQTNEIIGLLGTHIEMAKNGKDYPVGSTFQPEETDLFLAVSELMELHSLIKQLDDFPRKIQSGDVILYPVE